MLECDGLMMKRGRKKDENGRGYIASEWDSKRCTKGGGCVRAEREELRCTPRCSVQRKRRRKRPTLSEVPLWCTAAGVR